MNIASYNKCLNKKLLNYTVHKANHNHKGNSFMAKLLHCTNTWVTPPNSPNVGKLKYLHNKHFDLSDGATYINYGNHIMNPRKLYETN